MKYIIQDAKAGTTKTNKQYLKVTLKDPYNNVIPNVSIWSDFSAFGAVQPGVEVDGEVVEKNNFRNFKATAGVAQAVPIQAVPKPNTPAPQYTYVPENDPIAERVDHAQEKKTVAIDRSQTRKEVMEAKSAAAELIARHPAWNDLNREEVIKELHQVAHKIYTDKLGTV